MSLKNPVTPPEIDPGTVRLVAQRLNHYATPGPKLFMYKMKYTLIDRPQKIKLFLKNLKTFTEK
jgi:hypothetical protein